MIKKRILILMLVALSLILSACAPSEPPAESPIESSTPIETPAETPAPYDFSKIRFFTGDVIDMGEIKNIDEYNTKTEELIEVCKNYEKVEGLEDRPCVTWVEAFGINVTFESGCNISDDELMNMGLGETQHDFSKHYKLKKDKKSANAEYFASALALSQNEKVAYVEIHIMYTVVCAE